MKFLSLFCLLWELWKHIYPRLTHALQAHGAADPVTTDVDVKFPFGLACFAGFVFYIIQDTIDIFIITSKQQSSQTNYTPISTG